MTETLLSPSNVLLFGREVKDLQITNPQTTPSMRVRLATTPTDGTAADGNITLSGVAQTIDGVANVLKSRVLVKNQANAAQNGVYIVKGSAWDRDPRFDADTDLSPGFVVRVRKGVMNINTLWQLTNVDPEIGIDLLSFVSPPQDSKHGPFVEPRTGVPGELEQQLMAAGGRFARIYGFSFEGAYYELSRPALFLVHGEGALATDAKTNIRGVFRPARGLGDPSLTGVAAADFQFAEDLRVWSYDKADYTIRMDVETGMFEQVLLDMFFGGGGPGMSGARVSGARVSGARVSGARVSGARLSGGWSD